MGRITDYGSFYWCETCDNTYMPSQWDSDARACVYCAAITLLEDEEDG
jgi:hypothetical protein